MNKFIIENFGDIRSFLDTIGKRETNCIFKSVSSLASQDGSKGFTMTANYSESVELMGKGYKEGLDGLKKCKGVKVNCTGNTCKKLPQTGIAGYAPHVPNAVAGIPQNMISHAIVKQPSKVITIVYDICASSSVSADRFIKAGRNLLDVIAMLELKGYRVALDVQASVYAKSEIAICRVNVKNHRQMMNPLKIAYPLLHPSFLRRQIFKWLETSPKLSEPKFTQGYGIPLALKYDGRTDEFRAYLQGNGFLGKDVYFSNIYEAERHSAEELVSLMGIKKK